MKGKEESDTAIHMKYKTRAFQYRLCCLHVKTGAISSLSFSQSRCLSSSPPIAPWEAVREGGKRTSQGNGSSACSGLRGSQPV